MKPLIPTGSPPPNFREENLGDIAVDFFFGFVRGQLPSPSELSAYPGPWTPDHGPSRGYHWLDGTRLTNDRLWRRDPVLTAPAER